MPRIRDLAGHSPRIEDSVAAAFAEESANTEDLFDDLYAVDRDHRETIASLRRRRRRLSPATNPPIRVATLVQSSNGLLHWVDGVPVQPRPAERRQRRARRAGAAPAEKEGTVVHVHEFAELKPNKIVAAIGRIDEKLNPRLSIGTHLRQLHLVGGSTLQLQEKVVHGPFTGRTLLIVHGTFSNGQNIFDEFLATGAGRDFLVSAVSGPNRYDRILFFEHATLGVSPWMNALDLARLMAGSTGEIDVIAHSRGGIVVRWWLETFGNSMSPIRAPRGVLAGSPIAGTSLAAPDKMRNLISLTATIGNFAAETMNLAAAANPFLWVGGKLFEVFASAMSTLAGGPILDAMTAIVPGLCAQSRISNNNELDRLRLGPALVSPDYFVIKSNFEPEDPRWRFWRYLRLSTIRDRTADAAADVIFGSHNDLVVDTESMDDFGVEGLALAAPARDFGNSTDVWHCNYFRQPDTIKSLRLWLDVR